MQVASLDPSRPIVARPESTAQARSAAHVSRAEGTQQAPVTHAPRPCARSEMRRGLSNFDVQFQQTVAGAQQTADYLERLAVHLQSLRTAISGRLSQPLASVDAAGEGQERRRADGAALQMQIRRFEEFWRERPRAAGGRLDNRLVYSQSGAARQRFEVRGIQMASLRSGSPETLTFAVGGAVRSAAAVHVDPAAPQSELVRRLDHALAPSGVRVQLGANDELVFSVAERDWPNVRETLAVKGEGRRFPTGQFTPVRTIAEEAVLRPHAWNVDEPASLRRSLSEIAQAERALHGARHGVDRTLAEAAHRLQPPGGEREAHAESAWSAQFVRAFEQLAQRQDYRALSAFAPALHGVERRRVAALLGVAAR
ncbi:MAG: hypothetical protein RBS02_10780 [Steroidobacteraceae bacterium]|jgi:hypothetical protein|nr:hypothetical protein [Steroidobacteraceae bacterium]